MADVPPELVAEIDASEPDFVFVADESAVLWFEMAHAACSMLGLDHIHAEHCLEPTAVDADLYDKMAASAEALLTAVRAWLVEHDVPRLAGWYHSVAHDCFMSFALAGTQARVEEDEAP